MALYLNPDLDGPQETRGVCPLRLLEQTCSNVGRVNTDGPSCRTSGDHTTEKQINRPAKRPCSPLRDAPEKRHRRDSPARDSPPTLFDSATRYTCQWMGCGLHFVSVQELSRHLHVHVQAQARDASASASVQQLLTALPTPRASSSSSLSPTSTASVSPPTSPIPKPNLQSPTIANSAWLASWLVQYLASASASASASAGACTNAALPTANINQPAACNYAQAALTGSVNNYINGLTSPAAPRELTGYPVLSPFACGYPNGFSLLNSRFGNAV